MNSITYRIATGAQAGRKVTTLQTIPARTARRGRVAPRRPRRRRRNQEDNAKRQRCGHEPARPRSARCRESARNPCGRRGTEPRGAEIPLANMQSAPKPALARASPPCWAVRKGRLKFRFFRTICGRFSAVLSLRDDVPAAPIGRFVSRMFCLRPIRARSDQACDRWYPANPVPVR